MANGTETGHAKNVANFDKLFTEISLIGDAFKPSNENIMLSALRSKGAAAKASIEAVHTAESAYKTAVSERDALFGMQSKLITKVHSAIKASSTLVQLDQKAQSIIRKLQGRRASAKKTEEEKKALAEQGKTVVEVSSSQMSYDNRIENFDKLIKLLASTPAYAPNEEELKVRSLTSYYNELVDKNSKVVSSYAALNLARITRNEVLYKENTGLVDITIDVKNYIKSIYGTQSPQFKTVSSIKFVDMGSRN